MTRKRILALAGMAALAAAASAQEVEPLRADDHAPISVMGDHYHEAGEFMFSYRYMSMSMQDNATGSNDIAPDTIVTTVPNRFFGLPNQPPTLRVVPTEMTMDMHMLGFMYAPTDRVTLMGMLSHVDKEMDHVTYRGGMGTEVLGTFTSEASGIGDTSLAALISLHEDTSSRFHVTAGVSLPTGDTDVSDEVLAPNGMRPTLRLPYPMQLGSGTYDLLTGLTYSDFFSDRASWGMQWRGVIRIGDNDDGYTLGHEHRLSAWYSRLITPGVSWSARLEWFQRGNIEGIDPRIVAPVQTADPTRQAADRVDLAFGINHARQGGHRLAFEIIAPLQQNVDGPQLKTDWQLTAGYQFSF